MKITPNELMCRVGLVCTLFVVILLGIVYLCHPWNTRYPFAGAQAQKIILLNRKRFDINQLRMRGFIKLLNILGTEVENSMSSRLFDPRLIPIYQANSKRTEFYNLCIMNHALQEISLESIRSSYMRRSFDYYSVLWCP